MIAETTATPETAKPTLKSDVDTESKEIPVFVPEYSGKIEYNYAQDLLAQYQVDGWVAEWEDLKNTTRRGKRTMRGGIIAGHLWRVRFTRPKLTE